MKHVDTFAGRCIGCIAGILLCGFLTIPSASGQNYREVADFGWGIGVNKPAPVIVDIDGNGRFDMLVGTEAGGIMRFEQVAVNGRDFRILDRRFLKLRNASEASPTIADIDGDGRFDLLVGESGGNIFHYEQTEANAVTFDLVTNKFCGITGPASTRPRLIDLDGDGRLDMVIGSSSGSVLRYTQDGSGSMNFSPAADLKFSTELAYYNNLAFTDFENDGSLDLVMGNWDGDVMHFRAAEAVKDSFVLVEQRWSGIPVRTLGAPFFIDVDKNGLMDCFIGYGEGGVVHREQVSANSTQFTTVHQQDVLNIWDFGQESIYAIADLDRDGRLDILRSAIPMGESYMLRHPLLHMTQSAPGSFSVSVVSHNFNDIRVQQDGAISFADLDGDGRLDMFKARLNQDTIYHYQQKADKPYEFEVVPGKFLAGQIQSNGTVRPLVFRDLDNDGLLDLLLVCGRMDLFEQDAPGSSSFTLQRQNVISSNYAGAFAVEDLDGDGLFEMLVGANGTIRLFRQTQLHSTEFVKVADTLAGINVYSYAAPFVADVNADGRLDIIVGDAAGGLSLFVDAGPTSTGGPAVLPAQAELLGVSPHPVSGSATLRVAMPSEGRATVKLHDLLGRELRRFATDRVLMQGVSPLEIDARGLAQGCYLLVLETGGERISKPVLITR